MCLRMLDSIRKSCRGQYSRAILSAANVHTTSSVHDFERSSAEFRLILVRRQGLLGNIAFSKQTFHVRFELPCKDVLPLSLNPQPETFSYSPEGVSFGLQRRSFHLKSCPSKFLSSVWSSAEGILADFILLSSFFICIRGQ